MKPQRTPSTNSRFSRTDPHLWEITALQDLFWIGLALLAVWLGYYLRSIFTPVLIGLVLAYIFNPLISHARDRWGVPRAITIVLLISLMSLAAIGFVGWLGPIVIEQTVTLAQRLPGYVKSLATRYELNLASLATQVNALANQVQKDPISILQTMFTGTSKAFGFIGTFIGAATYIVASFALIPVYFFFFAWSWLPLTRQIEYYLPASQRDQILDISWKMNRAVAGFFRGRLLIAFLMAVMFAVGWLLAGVPYWFLLGVSAGILSIIPYAAGAAWIIAILLKYLDVTTGPDAAGFDWIAILGWPTLVYFVVQVVEGWILTPWVQSDSTNLSPLTVLIVVFIGGTLGGLYGLILAVPIAACLKIFAVEILLPRLERWAASG